VITDDILISIAKIKSAAESLKNSTAFLGEFELLDTKIPLLETTVNELIAGQGRKIADLFDLTGTIFSEMKVMLH
jgi:hypothetical protein